MNRVSRFAIAAVCIVISGCATQPWTHSAWNNDQFQCLPPPPAAMFQIQMPPDPANYTDANRYDLDLYTWGLSGWRRVIELEEYHK